MGKLDAVTEGSAGYENGIPQAHRANLHGQVNRHCGSHFARKNSMNGLLRAKHSTDGLAGLYFAFGLEGVPAEAGVRGASAASKTWPSRDAKVIPQREASVGAMSAGVTSP